MKILLSNDDGVLAPGLAALVKSLEEIAELKVVAPDRNRSGASNSLTLSRPLSVRQLQNGHFSVEGTPTDCVHLGLTGLLEGWRPDMVVAGVNSGANLGDDILYSGTVAAATEGRFLGLPAIAVSLVSEECQHFATAAEVTKRLIHRLVANPLPPNTILNVNVPDVPYGQLQGISATRLGTRHCAEPTVKMTDPRGNIIYWVGPPGAEQDAGDGTDFDAVTNKKVSVTPLQVDLTDYKAVASLSDWLYGLTAAET